MATRRRLQNGQLYVEGNWWKIRWWEDARGADGRPTRTRPTAIIGPATGAGKLSKKEAQRQAWDNILCNVNANAFVPQSLMTIRQFIAQKFEPECVWALKPSGRRHYENMFKYLLPSLGDVKLRDMNVANIQELMRKMLSEDYSVQTITHVKNAISGIMTHARRIGFFSGENPAALVRLPEMIRVRPATALTWEQAEKALEMMPLRERTMVLMSVSTSLNVAELCGLRWKRVNLTGEQIFVDGDQIPSRAFSVRENYYRGQFGTTKTGNRNRIQPLPSLCIPLLEELKRTTTHPEPESPVFASSTGKPVDSHNVANRLFKKIAAELGFKINWHGFRHSCATFAARIEMPRADRQALMGHGSSRMTDYYTHSDIERRRKFVDQIAERVTAKPAPEPTEEEIDAMLEKLS